MIELRRFDDHDNRETMRSLLWTLLLVLQACIVHAIHQSDVGVVDWYKQLVGVPLVASSSTAPAFRRVEGKEIILTATTSNVLAALSPEDGHVAWRYVFDSEDRIAGYYAHNDVVATLSGPGGAILRTFDIQTGVMVLEKQLHPPQQGHLAEPHFFGKHVAFGGDNSTDIYVLANGHTFYRMDRNTGEIHWQFAMPDASSLIIHTKVVLTPSTLYLVGIAKSTESYTLHVTSLVPETGQLITSANVPSSIRDPIVDSYVLSNGISENNRIVWLEQGSLKHVSLVPKLNAKPVAVKNAEFDLLVDIGLTENGHIIAVKKDGTGRIVKLVEDGVKSVHGFKDDTPEEHRVSPVYTGSIDETGRAHIARIYWSHAVKQLALEIYYGTQEVTLGHFSFDTLNNGILSYAALNVNIKHTSDDTGASLIGIQPQLLISTYTGNIQLIENGQPKWNRDEALTTSVVSGFVELPPPKAVVGDHEGETFVGRVARHLGDLQKLPAYMIHFSQRFFTSPSNIPLPPKLDIKPGEQVALVRDEFGFRQIIVVATMFGKVYGLDSASGEVVWTRLLGLGWAAQVGGRVIPVKMFVFNGEGVGLSGKGKMSDVVIVAQRRADNSLVDTVVFHIDAATGEDATGKIARDEVLEGIDIVQGPIVETYLLQHEGKKVVMFLDEFLQVYSYPDTPEAYSALQSISSSVYFPLRTNVDTAASQNQPGQLKRRKLIGHQIAMNDNLSKDRLVAYPVWTLSMPDNEDVVGLVSPQQNQQVASFGKVLANRTTLYKYLNPHMSVVLTAQAPMPPGASASADGEEVKEKGTSGGCGVYVVDTVKGSILYRTMLPLPGAGMKCDVKAILTENWLVYHYYDPEEAAVEEARGWRMVSVEMYEGGVDEKTKSSETSSFADSTSRVKVFEDSFVFTQGVTAMAMTKTKFGISTKDLIVATTSNKIQSYPRRILDPRRPRTKPSNAELEEGLSQYDPVLGDNPKYVLSHAYDVAHTQRITTAPSLLESTSLVLTEGLDMFLTRTQPSGTFDLLSEGFNKKQLVWTVVGLSVAILVVRPIVREKRLNGKWFF
ncbi:hypothetical protein NP233_g1262 [Leucocoprinus birnbaumii]|uniref:ER membrane protein complex subunit 1 n=1 Tax=Leucocoprinus birnbaumii TaxID=56174 RepID=A0AAD5W0N4_9AGAR|nr:hypothetical protein NP233_g1262 [Leucocoprinus birnbaumii]